MGSPVSPSVEQEKQLELAGCLEQVGVMEKLTVENHNADVKLALPRQGVWLLVVGWR